MNFKVLTVALPCSGSVLWIVVGPKTRPNRQQLGHRQLLFRLQILFGARSLP